MTITELIALAKTIMNASKVEENTAFRIGNAIYKVILWFFDYMTGGSVGVTLDHLYSPRDSYLTLAELEAAFPTGTEGIYCVIATGNWYFWNTVTEVWQSGGTYQAALDVVNELGTSESKVINQKVVSDELAKKKIKGVTILNTTSTLHPIFTATSAVFPAGLFLAVDGYGYYSTLAETTLSFANTLIYIYFDFTNKVFVTEDHTTFLKYNSKGHALVAVIRSGDLNIQSNYYTLSGILYKKDTQISITNNLESALKPVFVNGSTTTVYPQFTPTAAVIPAGLQLYVEGFGYYTIVGNRNITLDGLTTIYFCWDDKAFYSEVYGGMNYYKNKNYFLFAVVRPVSASLVGDVHIRSRYYSIDAVVYQNYTTYTAPVSTLPDRGIFESISGIAADVKTVFVNGIWAVKIYTPNPGVRYTLVALRKGGDEEIILYKTGTGTSALRVPQGGLVDIGNNLRRYSGAMLTDGAYIDIIVDWSVFTQEVQAFVNVSSNAVILQRNYHEKNIELTQLKLATKYCSTGASTSTYPWQDAVAAALGYSTYAKYGVASCKWTHNVDSVLTLSATPALKDNIMTNQLARLLDAKTSSSYSPDIITIMCGLNELWAGMDIDAVFGDFATIMAYNLSGVTVSDFFTQSQWADVRNKIYGAMRFYIEKVIKEFPGATVFFMTVQDLSINNSSQYLVKQLNSKMAIMAREYGLPVIDINGEAGMPAYGGISDTYLSDGIHPNATGSKILTSFVTQKIKTNFYSRK